MIYTITLNPALDYILKVKDFKTGEINRSEKEHILAGGKGINVSIVLKALEIESTALGFIAGFVGDEIERKVKEYGIKTDFIKIEKGISRINVKIAEPVEAAIRKYLMVRGETDSSAPLFSSISNRNSGGRMTTRSISRVAKNHLIEIDLKSDRLTAHSLRHTAATLNLLNGGTVEETKQLLGHANINTTLIYSHALERAKNDSESRIAKAIFG